MQHNITWPKYLRANRS